MKMIHNNKFNLIHDDRFEPEDKEDINLFIACLYIMAIILTSCLIVFIYQHF